MWLMRECEVVVTVCTHNIGIVSVVTSAAAAAGSPGPPHSWSPSLAGQAV